jgi:peptide-methionine (R)-S-oxide reductase
MIMSAKIEKTNAEWKRELTPQQYRVLRRKGTEVPYSGQLLNVKEDGTYTCAGCGATLFSSDTKFDSHTGWPSFTDPAVASAVALHSDRKMLLRRTEVTCASCGGHLGHVFADGPDA